MAYNLNGVVSSGFPFDDFIFTYLLSGVTSTDAAVAATAGKAVTLDTTAANTVKLTADNDLIFGRVFQAEMRVAEGIKTAAIQRKFKEKMPANVGHGIVVGDRVVGAAGGLVKKEPAATVTNPRVVEIGTDFVVVESI